MLSNLKNFARGLGFGDASKVNYDGVDSYLYGVGTKLFAKNFAKSHTGIGTIAGAGAGGLYGASSNDTSVLGGAMMGAGIGGIGARYGYTAYKGFTRSGKQTGLDGMWRALRMRGHLDYKGASLAANQGYEKIKGLWR